MRGGEYRISFTTVDTDTDKVLDAFKDRLQQCTDTFYTFKTASNSLPAYLTLNQAQIDFSKDCNVDRLTR
jgi:hypothetical protein